MTGDSQCKNDSDDETRMKTLSAAVEKRTNEGDAPRSAPPSQRCCYWTIFNTSPLSGAMLRLAT